MKKKKNNTIRKWIKEFLQIFIIAFFVPLIIRTFFFQPFNIPSGSMLPSLQIGDYLVVSKLSYGYSRYSFRLNFGENYTIQLLPVEFDNRIWNDKPQRGDVAVFKLPTNDKMDYIKRIIGLPGDRIQMKEGRLFINGKIVKREKVRDFQLKKWGAIQNIPQYKETLPNGVSYMTLDYTINAPSDNTPIYTVPTEHYFMMGDNRDNSRDSRYINEVGFVPYDHFIGRADLIFYSHDEDIEFLKFWQWHNHIRWNRLFSFIE